ncbi:MAG: hypothetical protein NUV86_06345 [Candidatus Scalindua sp.]|nr:hypothetical protein [Candidatus Scalindua sp.]
MIKKILIISLLTVSILFSSFYVKQKKAEAILPFVLYVAVGIAINYLVGKYIYKNIAGDIYIAKVSSYDPATGTVDLGWMENDYTSLKRYIETTTSGKNVYPEFDDATGWESQPFGESLGGTVVEVGEITEYNGQFYPATDNEYAELCDNWTNVDYCTIKEGTNIEGTHAKMLIGFDNDGISGNINDTTLADNISVTYDPNGGVNGGVYTGLTVDDFPVDFYEAFEDVPNLPNCFDGIQNQNETGVDCGGVCELNFGFVCPPPPETCSDEIMNQDETGIDYGGVCGTGDPVAAPAENFTDTNQDGVDDLSGLDATGSITVATPGDADGSTYDSSLPGDVSEVGETDWSGLITGYLATNPLVLLATGSSIELSGEECTLTANIFGTDIVLDFCSVEGLIDLIGTFVLGLMAIRSVFIAMGI